MRLFDPEGLGAEAGRIKSGSAWNRPAESSAWRNLFRSKQTHSLRKGSIRKLCCCFI
ncbi:hypothetical protein ACQCVP_02425 [Rossellomorea vietnamensis]